MSLRDDLAAMERHKANGTLKEWMEGTADPLPDTLPTPDLDAGRDEVHAIVQRFYSRKSKQPTNPKKGETR